MTHKFVPFSRSHSHSHSRSHHQQAKKGATSLRVLMAVMMFVLGGNLIGCNQASPPRATDHAAIDATDADTNKVAATAKLFSGCYSVDEDKVPQIKISQQAGQIVMQTRESDTTKGVWNTPEPMHILPLDQVTHYFSEEAQNIDGLIARPDNIFAVAHVKSAYVNINPLLDSDYLGFILKGANTIFKVECDI